MSTSMAAKCSARRHLDVEFPLAHARDTAELVLDGAGDAHEPMGFHLGQADDAVGRQRLAGQDQLLGDQRFVEGDLDRSGEVGLLHADLAGDRRQSGLGRRASGAADARRIAEAHPGAGLLQQQPHGLEDGRVGGDVLFRGGADQQVGLEQDVFPGGAEATDAPQKADAAAQGGQDTAFIVVGAGDQGDGRFHGRVRNAAGFDERSLELLARVAAGLAFIALVVDGGDRVDVRLAFCHLAVAEKIFSDRGVEYLEVVIPR